MFLFEITFSLLSRACLMQRKKSAKFLDQGSWTIPLLSEIPAKSLTLFLKKTNRRLFFKLLEYITSLAILNSVSSV